MQYINMVWPHPGHIYMNYGASGKRWHDWHDFGPMLPKDGLDLLVLENMMGYCNVSYQPHDMPLPRSHTLYAKRCVQSMMQYITVQ